MANKTTLNQDSNSNSITVDILDIVNIDNILYYKVLYAGSTCYIKLYKFEVQMLSTIKAREQLQCLYLGLDEKQIPRLVQDRRYFIDELYEADTVQTFRYVSTRVDYGTTPQKEYHMLSDSYGLTHRYYGELSATQRLPRAEVELYIKSINTATGNLSLAIYDPNICQIKSTFYSAEKVFGEIGETDNKETFFDCFFEKRYVSKPYSDLVWQYKNLSNLWLFTYLNIIDERLVEKLIRNHKIEELSSVCNIMVKLQNWMVEDSSYLELFSDETQLNTIQKSSYQIQKYKGIIEAVEIVKSGAQHDYIHSFIEKLENKNYDCDSNEITLVLNILSIYEDYLSEHIKTTIRLIKAIKAREDKTASPVLHSIFSLVKRRIKKNGSQVFKNGFLADSIDYSQQVIINDTLSLFIICILLSNNQDSSVRSEILRTKARFFHYLCALAPKEQKAAIAKAGLYASAGLLDDSEIFTWDNVINLDTTKLIQLTKSAIVWDSNSDNYHILLKNGLILLDTNGLVIVPKKLCIGGLQDKLIENIKVDTIHRMDGFPLCLSSMYASNEAVLTDNAVEQYLFWESTYKQSSSNQFDKKMPQIGDTVRVRVKNQSQKDKLKLCLFVAVDDPDYQNVDGLIHAKNISTKFISDVRHLFNAGDMFMAKVISVSNGKYSLSIKDEIAKLQSMPTLEAEVNEFISLSSACKTIDCAQKIEIVTTPPRDNLSTKYISEIVSLIDIIINSGSNQTERLTLIGYAHVLSAIIGDGISYYYGSLLHNQAYAEQLQSRACDCIVISKPTADNAYIEPSIPEESAQVDDDFDFFNETIETDEIDKGSTESVAVELVNTKYLIVNDNNSINIKDSLPLAMDDCLCMEISHLFPQGHVLILYSTGEVLKFEMKYLRQIQCDIDYMTTIDYRKISNYFIIPEDSQAGIIVNAVDEQYITLFNTNAIEESLIDNLHPYYIDVNKAVKLQPFILPASMSNPLNSYLGKSTLCSSISEEAVVYLKSFGVFI